jgi:hypothetical protein
MAHRTWIAGQQRIGGDQQQAFPLGLGEQQAIKGIAVQGRQLVSMMKGYRPRW